MSDDKGKKKKTIKLQSGEPEERMFEVARAVAEMSVTIKNMIFDVGEIDTPIPLGNVSGPILEKVIAYCEYHDANPEAPSDEKKDDKRTDDISPWDVEFCNVPQPVLFELILAANYLDIKSLLDVTCKTVANMIKGKTPEEIRKTFNIKNDFTPEEEEQVRKENSWCEEH
jgi:S-phase kinase-associated protein 1